MSDPQRLFVEADEFEKELLGSWRAEQPGDAARAQVLAMVGLGATVAGTAAAAGRAVAPKGALVGTAAVAKWVAIGLVGVAAAGAAVVYARHARQAPRETRAVLVAPSVAVETAPPVASPPSPLGAPLAVETTEAPAARVLDSRPPPPRAHAPAERAPAPLGEQVSLLDRARSALGAGDGPGALRELGEYTARFPRGALVEEAEVLRVEALIASGDRASAARAGSRFLSAHPGSPHGARVRALLDSAPP